MSRQVMTLGLAVVVLATALSAQAQEGRRGGGRGPGMRGFGQRPVGYLALLQVDVVKTDLKLTEDQEAAIRTLAADLRANAPERGAPDRDASAEERRAQLEKMQSDAAARELETRAKLAGVLDEPQMKRLRQIWIQRVDLAALENDEVAAELQLTEEQKTQLAAARTENREKSQAAMREAFGSGDAQAAMEKMNALREEGNASLLAVLTDQQKADLTAMKGDTIEFPENQGGFGGIGGGRPGGRGGEGRPGRRPDGEARPEGEGGARRPQRPSSN